MLCKKLDMDVYFFEYDDARSGDFSPRHLPDHKMVVLGVMTSKRPERRGWATSTPPLCNVDTGHGHVACEAIFA